MMSAAPNATSLYHSLRDTASGLQAILPLLDPWRGNLRIDQCCTYITHLLAFHSRKESERGRLIELIAKVGETLIPTHYYLSKVSFEEASKAKDAVAEVLTLSHEYGNQLVCI